METTNNYTAEVTQDQIKEAAKRFESRPITDNNALLIETIKGDASVLGARIALLTAADQNVAQDVARLQALAYTALEQAVMWAVKAASRKTP